MIFIIYQVPPEEMFADDFESGDLSAWTNATTDNGDLAVSSSAAHTGNYGLQAVIDCTGDVQFNCIFNFIASYSLTAMDTRWGSGDASALGDSHPGFLDEEFMILAILNLLETKP